MIKVESQVHGYRHGHELISASMQLDKAEQSAIDRLSDVAGPLRSGETFEPYLSAYPLPGGNWNVLARTWPDDTVSRPGCVRTLSLLIPANDWSHSDSLLPYFYLLARPGLPSQALSATIPVPQAQPLPPAPEFSAAELLEALFLEEYSPVAAFDVPEPELIAIRLLTALWPSMRRQFALSTLALSPRRIEGRDFDLVFAPRSARQKFAEWPGRKVDGKARNTARHRWTESIVNRVFAAPHPQLLDESELQSSDKGDGSTGALLRISMLWDELLVKLEQSPSAALGLLDIARTRPALSPKAQTALRAALSDAAQRAAEKLPNEDAWALVGAMTRKLRGTPFADEQHLLQSAAKTLARKDPDGALGLLASDDPAGALASLVAPIADGIATAAQGVPWMALTNIPVAMVVRLLVQGAALARRIVQSPELQQDLADFLERLTSDQFGEFRDALLSFLVEDFQLPLVSRFITSLDHDGLANMARGLVAANGFAATSFIFPLVTRARDEGGIIQLRESLLLLKDIVRRNDLLRLTLQPSSEDVEWLLNAPDLDNATSEVMLIDLLESAEDHQLHALLLARDLRDAIVHRIPASAPDVLRRMLLTGDLPIEQHIEVTEKALGASIVDDCTEIALRALERCLVERFTGDEVAFIARLLQVVGPVFNPLWAISHGLAASLAGELISRNLLAFDLSGQEVRSRIVDCVDAIATAFDGRWSLDLNKAGAQACANLFWSAGEHGSANLLGASARLVRMLFRSKGWPVSAIFPVTFPVVYRQLAAHGDVPESLKFFPLFGWDKCKAGRRELVDAFMSSQVWSASDFALTICQCPHLDRFLRRAARAYRGSEFLNNLQRNLEQLSPACREQFERGLRDARVKWF